MPSNTVLITTDYPPRTLQVTRGAGVLNHVIAASPDLGDVSDVLSQTRFDTSLERRTGNMNVSIFDGTDLSTATPLISIGGTCDSGPLNLSYSVGLLVVSRNPSAFNLTYTTS